MSLVTVLHNQSPGIKAVAHTAFAVLCFIGGALLENRLQQIFDPDAAKQLSGYFWIAGMVLVASFWGMAHYVYQNKLHEEIEVTNRQRRSIQAAREKVAGLHLKLLKGCDAFIETKGVFSVEAFRSALICDRSRLDDIIEAIWEVVDTYHNISAVETERVNFNVTLIVRSHRPQLQGNLTVAAWRNRDFRRPPSLVKQDTGEISIYVGTEADKIIRARTAETKVIEDTAKPEVNYKQLYDDQKVRIRNTVLHPILSPANNHLGVLVLHCEKPGLLKERDRRYWSEFFAVFAPAAALEIERIEAYKRAAEASSQPIVLSHYEPF